MTLGKGPPLWASVFQSDEWAEQFFPPRVGVRIPCALLDEVKIPPGQQMTLGKSLLWEPLSPPVS